MKAMNYWKNIGLATVSVLGLASVASVVHADESVAQVPTRTVRYSDLNLNTQAGAEMLYKRIRNAAEQVCGDVDSRQLQQAAAAKACVDRAIIAGTHAVNHVRLTSTYDAHAGAAQTATSASL